MGPLPLSGMRRRCVLGRPNDCQPVSPLREALLPDLARVGRSVIEDKVHLPSYRLMAGLQELQVAHEPGAVLSGAYQLDPPTSEGFDAAKHRDAPIAPDARQRRLLAFAMPDPAEMRIGLQMRLVLEVELGALWILTDLFPPPPPAHPASPPRRATRPSAC